MVCGLGILSDSKLGSTTRWPPSGHLPSRHLPLAFKRMCPKHILQYCNYQLPDHLYISLRITSIKASIPVLTETSILILFSPYEIYPFGFQYPR